jgi:hypothetical protein
MTEEMQKISDNKPMSETYDLQIKRRGWLNGLSCTAAFNAIQAEFEKLGDPNIELRFVIKENFTGQGKKAPFTVNAIMWDAICESPSSMRMYLRMIW